MKSKLPFTSVVSYHTNPMTCGVAKFGKQLADRIDVPFLGCGDSLLWGDFPLLSLKWSEIDPGNLPVPVSYGLFWHDAGDRDFLHRGADVVFFADPSLGSPGLWCPSLLTPRKRPVRLFSFGMAHKLQTEKYRRVRELLDAAEMPYHLRVSIGLHEGTSLDGAEKHFDALKEIMGRENVTILGILSDDAVSAELLNADHVVAFFEHGLRANNTTVHAALEHRCSVITNHDADTPVGLLRSTRDVHAITFIRPTMYSWDDLINEMEAICEASRSTATK